MFGDVSHISFTDNKATILDDPFIRSYIDDVLRSLRTQYLIDLLKPYTRLEISFLARVCIHGMCGPACAGTNESDFQQLHIEKEEVEEILIELILDGKIKGKVDQLNGRVELERLCVLCPFPISKQKLMITVVTPSHIQR